jgi:hypothetical protein
MLARDVVEILDRLDAAGVEAWLDGGWAVDAVLGEQTRPPVRNGSSGPAPSTLRQGRPDRG